MKIVIDSSVWLAGIGSQTGFSSQIIFKSFKNAEIEIFISQKILDEIKENLSKKFKFEPNLINEAEIIINHLCDGNIKIHLEGESLIKKCPQKDRHLLVLCRKIKADYLITFDRKHLLPLKRDNKTLILEPRDFVKVI